ncbi:MAG TPA: peroxidase family protein [Thermoanaerobaculia bacterium]|nr:peroxidase family protein [Thermoanaerobaculia bacterium]
MRNRAGATFLIAALLCAGPARGADPDFAACLKLLRRGFRPVAGERDQRFLGKVQEMTARCRGGDRALSGRADPWVDWQRYWATADAASRFPGKERSGPLSHDRRGVDGALLDLEYQRVELIKFNLFDNAGTYREYLTGRGAVDGPALKVWPELRLPAGHPRYAEVGGDGPQLCRGGLIRHRQLTGICNDLRNPLMGSTGMPFARNVQFEATFPELGWNELARNRHGGRLGLLTPDPQVISRRLFTRRQSAAERCNAGRGLPGAAPDARCDYQKAPFFNVLAAFWIQFMTHDWFSHLDEGRNAPHLMATGCASQKVGGVERALSPDEARRLGCRPDDRIDRGFVAADGPPPAFTHGGRERALRAYRTAPNTNTGWWDASQLYGYDAVSRRRVKRDPRDPAKLLLVAVAEQPGRGEAQGYLPLLAATDPMNPQWAGQEATAFPDNWTIGVSFYHNVFAREHNLFVEEFRRRAAAAPGADSGLRDPAQPARVVRYRDVTPDELFEAARLTIAAEIAKIHTIEWTTQLLYDEPLYRAMNGNWSGLFGGHAAVRGALQRVVAALNRSSDGRRATQWYSVLASGPGIIGIGSHRYTWGLRGRRDAWSLADPDDVNGGVNHFGSPFNFPEEFVTVYRLHPMVPDLIEYREWHGDPNAVVQKVPVVEAFRGGATRAMRAGGLANWALSLGRQRLGRLALENHAQFLQNLELPRLGTATGKIDVAALDVLRDRERGVPRFNEFRRQYGLRQLTSFDDFVDRSLPAGSAERADQERLAGLLREVYGRHRCDAAKPITEAQRNPDGSPIDDCLGHPDGSLVDNVEDVDTVVGWLAEPRRPHGFAISETQFQVFILNASRRLFSDRFFTSSFRPEFYSHLGIEWVSNNGPRGKVMEAGQPNGHRAEVSPLKRVLLRTVPELAAELAQVVNAFDPWARDRGEYYSLAWTPRPGAESDPAFRE